MESVTFSNITRNSVTVTVTNPESTSFSVYLRYKKTAETAWTRSTHLILPNSVLTVESTWTGLDGNTDYEAQASLDTDFVEGVVKKDFKTGPIEPPKLDIDRIHADSGDLRVVWSTPSDDGGSSITGYVVQWKSGSQSFDSSRQALPRGSSTTSPG